MKHLLKYILTVSMVFLLGCKKENVEKVEKVEKLPEMTQSGENTFGAMVNGQVWIPKGRSSFFDSNLVVLYDVDEDGTHSISVKATRRVGEKGSDSSFHERITMYNNRITGEGTYSLAIPPIGSVHFSNKECDYHWQEDVVRDGELTITRLDLEKGIISGIFEFAISKPGCPTVEAKEGRFDYRIF